MFVLVESYIYFGRRHFAPQKNWSSSKIETGEKKKRAKKSALDDDSKKVKNICEPIIGNLIGTQFFDR